MDFFTDNAVDDGNTRLLVTRDCLANSFDIQANGRHVFYDNEVLGVRKCQRCNDVKTRYEKDKFGERRMVLSRDYSGENKIAKFFAVRHSVGAVGSMGA